MTVQRYTRVAMLLHWLIGVTILCLFALGLYMSGLPLSPLKLRLYSYHKWAGVTVAMLVLVRLAWRIGHAPPPLPASQARWQQTAAHAGHALLYVLMLAVPVSGWLMSSAHGFTTVWFGVLPLPDLLAKNHDLAKRLDNVHAWLNYSFMALVAGHALAAVKHQLLDRDGTLSRMLPAFSKEKTP